MHLLNRLICKTFGHAHNYYQTRIMICGRCLPHNEARCARCDSANSVEIHTPGLLDFPARILLGAEAPRFSLIEWHRGKRRALRRLFRKRTSYFP